MARLRLQCCYQGEAWDPKTNEWRMACDGTEPLATVLIDGVDRGVCADWQGGKYLPAGTSYVEVRYSGNGCCMNQPDYVDLPPGGDVTQTFWLARYPD
jgi:hypothetical protein